MELRALPGICGTRSAGRVDLRLLFMQIRPAVLLYRLQKRNIVFVSHKIGNDALANAEGGVSARQAHYSPA